MIVHEFVSRFDISSFGSLDQNTDFAASKRLKGPSKLRVFDSCSSCDLFKRQFSFLVLKEKENQCLEERNLQFFVSLQKRRGQY